MKQNRKPTAVSDKVIASSYFETWAESASELQVIISIALGRVGQETDIWMKVINTGINHGNDSTFAIDASFMQLVDSSHIMNRVISGSNGAIECCIQNRLQLYSCGWPSSSDIANGR